MTNPFLSPERLNPRIASEVQAAYDKNLAEGRVVDASFAGGVGVGGLGDIIRSKTSEAKAHGIIGLGGLELIANPEVKQAFEDSFSASEHLFERISLSAPTAEQFGDVGVDFAALATSYKQMERDGLEPALVVAPSLSLIDQGGLMTESWPTLYRKLTGDQTIPHNPLRHSVRFLWSDDHGLDVDIWDDSDDINININAQALWEQELSRIVSSSTIHHYSTEQTTAPVHPWTVAILPASDQPQAIDNILHTDFEQPGNPKSSDHATISQYLTLQATRIQNGEPPLDASSYTWLQGNFASSRTVCAPSGYWLPATGQVIVTWSDTGLLGDSQGVRLPVWG